MPARQHPKRLHIDKRAAQLLQSEEMRGEDDKLLDTKAVAARLGLSVGTLEIARHRGSGGPPWIRLDDGRIRYPLGLLKGWLQERVYTHTAQYMRGNGADAAGGVAAASPAAGRRSLRRRPRA